MALKIIEIHSSEDPKELNTEWIVVENIGDVLLNLRGCEIAKGHQHSKKNQNVAKLDPGFALNPKEKKRIVSGNPRSTVQGTAPGDEIENYFLFLKVPYITKQETSIRILRGQALLAHAVWDPEQENGLGTKEEKKEAKESLPKDSRSSTAKIKKKGSIKKRK